MIHAAKRASGKIVFVTGTDTGVGKTLVAAHLLYHLRQQGCHVLAMKPFECGNRKDARLLQRVQENELSIDEINPFYFREPVAPLVAMRMRRSNISLHEVIKRIKALQKKCDCLIVEGCGGLLTPLGSGYSAVDLIAHLGTQAVIVSRNQLGTLNHTLLTVRTLEPIAGKAIVITLMNCSRPDVSSRTNLKVLEELLGTFVLGFPFLGRNATSFKGLKINYKKVKKTLAQILA